LVIPFSSALWGQDAMPVQPKWADERLTYREGLELWLDVNKQGEAWSVAQNRPLIVGQQVDVVFDSSGWQRDARQDQETAFPLVDTFAGQRVLKFDGIDDFLRIDFGEVYGELTLFAVVSAHKNAGLFRSFLSAAKRSRNDYTTGLNIDLGPSASTAWDMFNIEGAGFNGATDYTEGNHPFDKFQLLEVRVSTAEVKLWVNGIEQKSRRKNDESMVWDSAWLGARYYSNDAKPARVSGFWDGAIAEVLMYRGPLAESQQKDVRQYLTQKHRSLFTGVRETLSRHPLETLKTTPEVQVLIPGFQVRKLPVELTNVNNIRYRDDGKLIALGYNGNVFVLSDTDGDGLEDSSKLFWENKGRLRGPIGLYVTPNEYSRGRGVIVASKGKVSFLHDRDGDDIADEEQVIASGWKEIPQNVDAVGIAVAPDESIYFALGTTNYANGYLLDNSGKANFDLQSERGNILRISPDWKRRESICKGVRFPVALDFNADGELFATDQEGATWLSNGNPFDELLHIQRDKYYGFPPFHPQHLPTVIDEPSVFDYGPQHQSTCGLFFNRSVCGGPLFGPDRWKNSAFVCGESRGKIFRTDVLRGSNGYMASNSIIACLNQLTVDCCVTPTGSLLVACHSGPPDWGTGPEGKGSLYLIEYVDTKLPQPVLQWCSGANEISVAFDRELTNDYVTRLSKNIRLESGPYNAAGDRFETLAPPYAVVQMQRESLRNDLPLLGVALTPDRRTLKLLTAGLNAHERVSLVLPSMDSTVPTVDYAVKPEVGIDLVCDMTGVVATWTDEKASEQRSVVLPHIEDAVNRAWTNGSAEHVAFWDSLKLPGKVVFETSIDVTHLLQPRVQVGATLDYTPEWEEGVIHLQSRENALLQKVRANGVEFPVRSGVVAIPLTADVSDLVLEIEMGTGAKLSNDVAISFAAKRDAAPRNLALHRFSPTFLAKEKKDHSADLATLQQSWDEKIPVGAWLRGREIYYGIGLCSRCHTLRGLPGGALGPDLSNLGFRDDASILRDIRQPSATLNPDHLMVLARLQSGEVVSGVPITNENKKTMLLGLGDGTRREVDREEIEEIKPATISLMPTGLVDALSADQLNDLMVFLKRNPLEPTVVVREDQPPYRSWAEFQRLPFAMDAFKTPMVAKPMHIVLCDGPKDHGPDEHDYPEWKRRWVRLLGLVPEIKVEEASEWPTEEQLNGADLIVFFSANPQWKAEKGGELDKYLARGGGLVFMHFAVNGQQAVEPLALRIGLACDTKVLKYRHGAVRLQLAAEHPLTSGLPNLDVVDESYWKMTGDPSQIQWVATGEEDNAQQPLIWTVERGKGRVFVSIMGHYSWTLDDPLYRVLLLRGMMWAGHQPQDSLLPLSTVGARIR
jgi:putative heme-binding domain-containing protein